MSSNFNNFGRFCSDQGIPDMTSLSKIDIEDINQNLRIRYEKDQIYQNGCCFILKLNETEKWPINFVFAKKKTYTGSILIAVNPYKTIDMYDANCIRKHNGRKLGELEPHIYAIAEAAYALIQLPSSGGGGVSGSGSGTMLSNQSIVISGESGAGKTENTKFILQYLCSVTSNVSSWIEHQILEANTILESFGNAKTIKNDNSSRFGKFIQVCFGGQWKISGCFIQDYLLEQSRITFQSKGERNYHIFYQLLDAAKTNSELSELLYAKDASFFNYLNQSGCVRIEGVEDSTKFEALILAFNILQISTEMSDGIFKVLSAILWLGNLSFEDIDGEKCKLCETDYPILETVSKLLGLETDSLLHVLLLRQINVRGNITEIPLKLSEARENRHAMAKALYSRTFAWLISHINNSINPGQESSRFLGVLDIFGFENFQVNSFEQLCINYTNEKLHKFFNHYVFALEQEIYSNEGINFSKIKYTDNTVCLELIEKPPRCVLKLLTEQCHMPKGSDLSYLLNLHGEFESHPYYVKGDDRRKWETEFGVRHYAGLVTYSVKGFVDKNRDVQQDVFFDFMSRSNNLFVCEATKFQDLLNGNHSMKLGTNGNTTGTVFRGTNKGKPTVGDTFRFQLQSLVDVLQSTNPWYVRCIKPNSNKQSNDYNNNLVIDQLKYLGMLDIIRIRKEGYPIHMVFDDFLNRYYFLLKNRKSIKSTGSKLACQKILELEPGQKSQWQIGTNKIFLRSEIHKILETKYETVLLQSVKLIQKMYRGYRDSRQYQRMRKAAGTIQYAYRGWKMRIEFLRIRRATIVIQSHLRGFFAREVANALREMRTIDEQMKVKSETDENCDGDGEVEGDNEEQQKQQKDLEMVVEQSEQILENEIKELSKIVDDMSMSNGTIEPDTKSLISSADNLSELCEPAPNPDMVNGNQIIDEIDAKMDELVEHLDLEIENVVKENEINSNSINVSNKSVRSLPEPTEPPPPPPLQSTVVTLPTPPVTIIPPPETTSVTKPSEIVFRKKEPIYESVIPRTLKNINLNTNGNTIRRSSSTENKQISANRKSFNELTSALLDKENRRQRIIDKRIKEFHNKENHLIYEEKFHDIVEFAQKCFNNHERSPEGTIMQTLTKRANKCMDILPKYEMITFHKGYTIPNSHINLHDPDNVNTACSMFRDLCKYFRGEFNVERETLVIQTIIGNGLEREELRDEIYVQCIRQITNNPHPEWAEKIWILLALCIVSFQPSRQLHRYFVCFLKKNLQIDMKLKHFAQWCLDNCNSIRVSCREYPPSTDEIAAVSRLGTIVCRFFMLDGRTKAIDIHPCDTADQAVRKLCDRLGLKDKDGWAIFENTPDSQQHIRAHYYIYDTIASWELKQTKFSANLSLGSQNRRSVNSISIEDNKFVFRKRLFREKILSQDPIEVGLLYAQAVHSVVKCDEFPVTERVALQLAGLQAQVSLGDPKTPNKPDYYSDIDKYLPYRISRVRSDNVWAPILAHSHVQYGAGRSELTAKALYLSCVMQYPLYGTTMFPVIFRGFWNYDNSILLGVNSKGIQFIKLNEKVVLFECSYSFIESILLDPSDSFITITLTDSFAISDKKCNVFETKQKDEIGSLIASYCPELANWIVDNEVIDKKYKSITNDDRIRLYHNLVNSRRQLIDNGLVKKPSELSGGGFIKSTLRRLSKHRLDKLRQDNGNSNDHSETYKGYSYNFWAFSRHQLAQSISKLKCEADEQVTLQLFQQVLNYAGLMQTGENVKKAENDRIHLIQVILDKAYEKDDFIDELFLQLIKQTTDHPDPNSRVNLRHWALLSLVCSVVLPTQKLIQKYLLAHLKRCASDYVSEEGKYARFAEQSYFRTQASKKRKLPPMRNEIICTINRRPVYIRLYLMDKQYYSIEFHPCQTVKEVVDIVKEKIGLKKESMGYGIYEVHGNLDFCLNSNDHLADIMSRIERNQIANKQNTNQSSGSGSGSSSGGGSNLAVCNGGGSNGQCNGKNVQHFDTHFFLFKKHLFLDHYLNNDDLVEKELLYHQLLHSLRTDKFPVNEKEATMLIALQAQVEKGDYIENNVNYREIAINCLSERVFKMISFDAVIQYHQSLRGMTQKESKNSFLNLIKSWSLYKSTIFDIMQTFTSIWPKILWLAIDQKGLHLLHQGSRNVLCTYEYRYIISYYPTGNYLMILIASDKGHSKIVLTTPKALQIASLINDYINVLKSELMNTVHEPKADLNGHLNDFTITKKHHMNGMVVTNIGGLLVEPQPG